MTYAQALREAQDMQRAGVIRRFMVEHDSQRGKLLYVETEQGWNPDPFYVESEPEPEAWHDPHQYH